MLRISEQTLKGLAVGGEKSFERRVHAMLVDEYGVPPVERDALLADIRLAITDARDFGLTKQRSVATYCVSAFLAGLLIRDDSMVKSNLKSAIRSEDDKISWLEEWILALEASLES